MLTKQHGIGLNTWEINFIRFGAAAAALALGQGLTLLHFLAQRKRFLWDRGCIAWLCRGC